MHGFKSFAEPVSIEFNEGITCIVGPNGSGKSNISDAIRWVLGEQSPKALRGGKMEEVIFAGTANRKSRGMAEVTLVIDNSTGILDIDYNEVAITRRMYRSGESEYRINGNPCRLRDIKNLIMDTGIGVDGYSIIGQGKISEIVSNKTESRREIFEEAAGIVTYRTKKAEAERKLDSANANLERVNDIIAEIEGRIGNLKEDSEKAKEYLSLRERYKELEINITLKNVEALELKNEYLTDDIAEAVSNIEDLKEEKINIDKENAESLEKNALLEKLVSETNAKLMANVEQLNSMVSRSQLNTEKLASIESNSERLRSDLENIDEKLAKEKNNAEELQKSRSAVEERLTQLEGHLNERIEKHALLSSRLAEKAADIDEKKNEVFRLHSEITSKNSDAASLSGLKSTLDRRKEQILGERRDSETTNTDIKKAREEQQAKKIHLEEELEKLRTAAKKNRELQNISVIEERQLSKETEELRISIGQISARKKTIEEMESNYEGYNYAVKFIMKSGIRGIDGVIADLIRVPEGFETAIETALGGAMQNVVCERDKDAQQAIDALKESKAGRLTFLPVESIRGGRPAADSQLESAAGFRGYGVDCIEYDSKYENIMQYLLGRVVVVSDLDHAFRLSRGAKGGLRFVTLDGEIINTVGAITGGRYKNKTANLLERKAEITSLQEKLDSMLEQKNSSAKRLESLRNTISGAAEKNTEFERAIREAEIELATGTNELKAIDDKLGNFRASEEKWQKELEDIRKENDSSDSMIEELRSQARAAEEKKTWLEAEIDKALIAYEEEKKAVEQSSEEIVNARMEVTGCRTEKSGADTIVERVEATIAELNGEYEAKSLELRELEQQRTAIISGPGITEEELEKVKAEKLSNERYLEELKEEKASVFAGLNESTAKKESIDTAITQLQDKKYELDIKKAKNETHLENMKNKLWEEFEISYVQAIELKKKDFSMNAAVKENREIKSRIKELGDVNVGAIREYETVGERYEFLTDQRKDILEATGSLKQIIDDMDKTIRTKFKESFDAVLMNFEEIFKELFGGGNAQLRLDDESKPLESGIEIVAQPPGKKLQNINLMSGGEKTMTAIALMFAVLKTKPTPFCILDEVEAALDDANIDRFANYLKNFREIQFALVTHQKATMEHADVLYGVTMPEQGVSKVISLKLGDEFALD